MRNCLLLWVLLVAFLASAVLALQDSIEVDSSVDVSGEHVSFEPLEKVTTNAKNNFANEHSQMTTLFKTGYELFSQAQVGNKVAELSLASSLESTSSSGLYGDDEALVRSGFLMIMYGTGGPTFPKNISMAESLAERILPFLQRQLRSLNEKDEDYKYVAFVMYFILSEGWGASPNMEAAIPFLLQAADAGLPAAENTLASNYIQGKGVDKDHTKAVSLFRRSAEQGDVFGKLYYGLCFYFGHGIDKDQAKALEWFRKAAADEFAEAEYLVGYCHATGQGIGAVDYVEAAKWYEKAALGGQAEAQFSLGYYFNVGLGGKTRDLERAMYWYKLAIEHGNRDAKFFLPAATFIDHVAAIVEKLYPLFSPLYPYVEQIYALFPK